MGWRLAEEVAWARPQRPGPEWWTFMDIAQNANDDTRRGWPGREYLMARSKRSARTVDRYLRALIDANLIKRVRPASAGHRPVYEILILFDLSTTRVTKAGVRPNPQHAPAEVARVVDDSKDPHAPALVARVSAPALVAHLPSSIPSYLNGPVSGGSLEGTPQRSERKESI